ncbi:hypothetical protein H2198_010306 [Neophaeococcomyces mojaviensis]|uniref:Uncharacterized protein n=1 Tax=Neophaeococcomyces mojaviensis TaxID=3383035 RepID=A0ACC2ZSE4_9EURO|nr:hypothetical protein H2198_010306 [Knufia sp. JES_112]
MAVDGFHRRLKALGNLAGEVHAGHVAMVRSDGHGKAAFVVACHHAARLKAGFIRERTQAGRDAGHEVIQPLVGFTDGIKQVFVGDGPHVRDGHLFHLTSDGSGCEGQRGKGSEGESKTVHGGTPI